MGVLLSKQPSQPPNKQLVQILKQKTLKDLKESVDIINSDYQQHVCLTQEEFDDIFGGLLNDCEPFFFQLQTYEQEQGIYMVDLFECLACFGIVCGDEFNNKLYFIYKLFDFDNSNTIEQCELILVLQTVIRGLCKFVNLPVPDLYVLEDIAKGFFSVIDSDLSQKIEFDEFQEWVSSNSEFQEFLLKYAYTQTIQNAYKRMQILYEQYMICFDKASNNTSQVDINILKGVLVSSNLLTDEQGGVDFLFKVLTDTSNVKSQQNKTGIEKSVYQSVIRAWTSFDATDINNIGEQSLTELKYLLWLYEGAEPSNYYINQEYEVINVDLSDMITKTEWLEHLCVCDKVTDTTIFCQEFKFLFEKYDLDKSRDLDYHELRKLLFEVFNMYYDYTKTNSPNLDTSVDSLANDIMATLTDINNPNTAITWSQFKSCINLVLSRFNQLTNLQTDINTKS